jgi:hypothetical protein
MSSSRPRPIHNPHREIRSTPDEAEPSFSYEQESFLAVANNREGDDVEDEFHRRLAQQQSGQRRESSGSHGGGGSSFWRTQVAENAQQGPSFSSANLNASNNSSRNTSNPTTTNNSNSNNKSTNSTNSKGDVTTARERKTSGLLGAALQSHALSEGGTLHESVSVVLS